MTAPKDSEEPRCQPDPHEEAAKSYVIEWWDSSVRNFDAAVQALAGRLREREAAAERRGAEAMQEKIAQEAGRWSHIYASEVRALPLPGDK